MASGLEIVDDKSPICIPFILKRIKEQQRIRQLNLKQHLGPDEERQQRPFVIGLNGVQGVGKTTLVGTLAKRLQSEHGLETLVVSIDDFYLTNEDQKALAVAQPDNKLVACRGEPGKRNAPFPFTSILYTPLPITLILLMSRRKSNPSLHWIRCLAECPSPSKRCPITFMNLMKFHLQVGTNPLYVI